MVTEEQLEIPQPPPRWWLRIGLTLVVVCALVAGGLWAHRHFLVRCADGVSRVGPDAACIGVTDGDHVFHEDLTEVIGLIREENRRVEESGEPWVSIAYFEPMTLGEGDKGTSSIEQELQGAYLAQYALNRPDLGGEGSTPQIRLLLANPGSGSAQWETVVEQILGMTDGPNPVVAVAGFGQSRATTKKAVERFREHRIPMVGSTVTADGLSERGETSFFRAVAPNSDQTAAVVEHLRRSQREDEDFTVRLVEDGNDHDIYSSSLRQGFVRAARDKGLRVDPVTLRFLSNENSAGNALATVADKVCDDSSRADAVYFAGRGRALKTFIEAAGAQGRTCPTTVYSGDDAVGMFFDLTQFEDAAAYRAFLRRWDQSAVQVQYTALAHPDAAATIYAGDTRNPYADFLEWYEERFTSEADLYSGQAMLGYDATFAVGLAVRSATGENTDKELSPGDVRQMLGSINGETAVRGVSGPLSFGRYGNPENKPLPLVRLDPAGDTHHYVLEDVLSPEGPREGG
ncbi:hypothetical protein E4198_05225 [Streptomyces sp. RKND-216]|uniref:ABC transporter substrate-binding protein n=1 Tax=Streptomyces sp. RKND-216 TaxID=2562581 RepID=UPI00109D9FFA|nr:ABC transporter substrate-binding protein [Streptomyces sp. RKND-216]THA24223.1 hypothetical protein E4198_05225 [Streptomyces sp. RKND-216]